jgi:hypothetical protein
MIHHQCPHCGEHLSTSIHLEGMTIPCRQCHETVEVPNRDGTLPTPHAFPPTAQDIREAAPPAAGPERPLAEPLQVDLRPIAKPGTSNRAWWTRLLGVLAAVYLLLWLGVWCFAGYSWVGTTLGILAVVFGVLLFFMLRLVWDELRWGPNRLRAVLTYLGVSAAGAVFFVPAFLVNEWFAQGVVYVDNYSRQNVTLELDGQPWLSARQGTTTVRTLRRGAYTVVVRSSSGEELDRLTVTVDGGGNYVLNVLRAQVYARGTAKYGGAGFLGEPPEQRIDDAWFKVDVYYLFEEPPSSVTVSTRRGQAAWASRPYLRRGEPRDPKQRR